MPTPVMNRATRERLELWARIFWEQEGVLERECPSCGGLWPEGTTHRCFGSVDLAQWEDEPYYCRSCDAALGSEPQPCPRCDGLPGYGNPQYDAEVEAELAHHDAVYGPEYGTEFNPIPFETFLR